MSDEEAKVAGENVALSDEEIFYKAAISNLNDAQRSLQKAKSVSEKWEPDHEEEGFSPLNAELQATSK
jgi:hypothetical protein